jgi:hypothetical protein
MSKLKPLLVGLLVLVIYALHQDFWNWNRIEPVFFGFVPVGLGYHAVYSLVAAALMWLLVKWVWPADLNRLEKDAHPDEKEPRP